MAAVVRTFEELAMDELPLAGGKGGSLARLYQAHYPVPDGFVILPAAFAADGLAPEAWAAAWVQLDRLRAAAGDRAAFAVRSSAMGEDSAQASFAGEFETVLNVQTDEQVREAIDVVYRSRQSERAQAYSQAKGLSAAHEIAVVVQVLVDAERSGVLFTANPVTGERDHAMISAAWGLGEAIVGGRVTPDTLIAEKATGRVLVRDTADKQVMTVRLESGTQERPVPEPKRRAPVLSDREAAELVRLGAQIEALYGMPMDIEWAWAASQLSILQARPITALPSAPAEGQVPELPAPTEWALPKGNYIAMRNNIVELMADPLTPLFGTLGRAAVNASMRRLLDGIFGRPIISGELIIQVNEYAYYNGSMSAGEIVRIILGSVGTMKRMFTGAVERWTEVGRPRYTGLVDRWRATPWRTFPATEILGAVRELAEGAIDAHMALLSGVIPAAWISEGLFTMVYNTLIKRRDDPEARTFLMGYDSLPIQADKSLYDLAAWARARPALAAYVCDTPTPELVAQLDDDGAPQGVEADDWRAWRRGVEAHLEQFGHMIYSLDFGNPVPADDPAPLLETLRLYVRGRGTNPHVRQQTAAEQREEATETTSKRLKGLRLRLFRRALASAQRYAPLREDGLADIGLGYPLLREMLREVGDRLVAGGAIAAPGDIYWLYEGEVAGAAATCDRGEALEDLSVTVVQHRATWRAARRATPPLMLPVIKVLGVDVAELKSGQGRRRGGNTLKGVAASGGRVTATARVLHGPADFAQMRTGDVLVAPLTTPAWTPLFARAAAVVTDIGGPLSHGSIVAREYGIPAVLGTGAATKRLRSGQTITVDGNEGLVTVVQA
ncbi:MAG: phosphoenolpyruvate synthase [Anaerolineae bacterium]|nr:phosphoenolpyruvate synthase [Anaerolineae bacterium]